MKLGINSYTFMWSIGFQGANPAYPDKAAKPTHPMTAIRLLETARQLGLGLVQTGPNLKFDLLSKREQDEFIGKARDWGIELEVGTRGLDVDHIRQQVALARRMNARLIRTLPEIGGAYCVRGSMIPPAVRPLLPILEAEGVRLGIENGRTPGSEIRAALDEIGSPSVGIILDMVNSLAVPEGWKEVTRLLAPNVMCVHYKDFTIQRAWHMMGFNCVGAPSGKGMVETDWLLNELRRSAYDFNVIIESWPQEQTSVDETAAIEKEWAQESVAYLRRYIQN
jgi:3-oxoisoapionate decarboxylase